MSKVEEGKAEFLDEIDENALRHMFLDDDERSIDQIINEAKISDVKTVLQRFGNSKLIEYYELILRDYIRCHIKPPTEDRSLEGMIKKRELVDGKRINHLKHNFDERKKTLEKWDSSIKIDLLDATTMGDIKHIFNTNKIDVKNVITDPDRFKRFIADLHELRNESAHPIQDIGIDSEYRTIFDKRMKSLVHDAELFIENIKKKIKEIKKDIPSKEIILVSTYGKDILGFLIDWEDHYKNKRNTQNCTLNLLSKFISKGAEIAIEFVEGEEFDSKVKGEDQIHRIRTAIEQLKQFKYVYEKHNKEYQPYYGLTAEGSKKWRETLEDYSENVSSTFNS